MWSFKKNLNKNKIGKNDNIDIGNNKNNKVINKGKFYNKDYRESYYQLLKENDILKNEIKQLKDGKDYILKKVVFLYPDSNEVYNEFIKCVIKQNLDCSFEGDNIKILKADFPKFIKISKKSDFRVHCFDYPDCQIIEPPCLCNVTCGFKFE